MRTGAYLNAVQRVADATAMRGPVPVRVRSSPITTRPGIRRAVLVAADDSRRGRLDEPG